MHKRWLWLLVICFSMSGCGSSQLSKRVSELERQLKDVRSIQAEHTAQLDTLDGQIRRISGKAEELSYAARPRVSGNIPLQDSANPSFVGSTLLPPIVPADIYENDQVLADGLDAESSRLMKNAFVRIREGNFTDALPILRDLLAISGGQNWMANVIFWMGVCHEGQGTDEKALAAYYDLVRRFPQHELATRALLRQGAAFTRLGDMTNAKLTYKKLVAKYPSSPEAGTARQKLRGM